MQWLHRLIYSRRLEEIDPPVSGSQVEHVGPLAVVRSFHGQRVVDGHGVLQVLVGQLLIRPVLPLEAHGSNATAMRLRGAHVWQVTHILYMKAHLLFADRV